MRKQLRSVLGRPGIPRRRGIIARTVQVLDVALGRCNCGFVYWGEIPSPAILAGAALVMLSGLYMGYIRQ